MTAGEVSPELRADILDIVSYLRSALDYCARELYERYATPTRKGTRPSHIGFPVLVPPGDWRSLLGSRLHGLEKCRPDLAKLLEGYQVTTAPDNQWLVDLHSLWTESKHDHLGRQVLGSSRRLVIAGFLSIAEGANVTVEGSVFDGHVIKGPQRVGVDNPPEDFSGSVEEMSSPAFVWELGGRKLAVLPLLAKAVSGVERIVREVIAAA